MQLRKVLAMVVMVCGLTLLSGAAVVGFGGASIATTPTPDLEIVKAPDPSIPLNTDGAEAVWRDWMAQNGVTQSSFAIGRDGVILHSAAQKRFPDTAYPMASLSKAVTAICLNQLLINSRYSWESTLADLASELATINVTLAPQIADLTLTQIATHTSGLPEILNYGNMLARSANLNSQSTMAKAALMREENLGTRGSYVYSNANYAILGFLIEAMTGQPYGEHCKASIMTPAGATQAAVAGRMAFTAGYGGWSVSVEDYARFAMHWFAPDQPWMASPANYAYDQAVHYGMGTHVYPTSRGTFVSHSGRWTYRDPQKPNIGAMFFVRDDGTTVVINWDGSLDYARYGELHDAVRDAL